jgi:hypothetical protein
MERRVYEQIHAYRSVHRYTDNFRWVRTIVNNLRLLRFDEMKESSGKKMKKSHADCNLQTLVVTCRNCHFCWTGLVKWHTLVHSGKKGHTRIDKQLQRPIWPVNMGPGIKARSSYKDRRIRIISHPCLPFSLLLLPLIFLLYTPREYDMPIN